MLNKPSINTLMKNVDSKYTLVILAAKRARSVIDDNPDLLAAGAINPVSLALDEVSEGKLSWENAKNSVERKS
ncbi:MAG: DNA-directed RNA polymerase subunit omega [Bacillota bacterium]|nr:DNA-directed RNA polymerase subunit omega [Bacillota bacterium]